MRSAKDGPRLTKGPIGKSIRSLMFPMLMGMVALISYNLADTYFVGRLGTMELAAISFTFPVSFIVGAVTMAFGIGTSSVCSRLFGANKLEDVERVAIHTIMLGVVTGLIVVTIGLLTIDPLFTLLGADETTLPVIRRYMRIYYWSGFFLVIPMITNSVLRASGNAKTPAMIMAGTAIMNVILDPILIFGLFGFPRLEVEGAAIATVLSNSVTMVVSISYIVFHERLITFRHFWPKLIFDSWRRVLHVGLPSMTSSLIAPVTTAFITYQVAQFGQEAVAGFGVASRMEGLSLLAMMSLSGAVTPFVGQNFGAQNYDRVQAGVRWCQRFTMIYGLIVAIILAVTSEYIAEVFTEDPKAVATANLHMRIVPLSYFMLGFAMIANGAFNAIGKPMPAMFISLTRTILLYAPMAFILANLFGIVGVFVAACTANLIAGSMGFLWFRHAFRKIVHDQQAVTTA
jgi:putative MATE family efflux protein